MSSYNKPKLLEGFKAGADLSAKLYHAVKIDTATGKIVLCGAGERSIGFLMNKPLADDACEIASVGGGALGVSAATLAAGVELKADASGHLVAASANLDKVVAISLESSVDNDVFSILPLIYEKSI